jgi:hypothetical protein
MVREWWKVRRAVSRFTGYEPQPVTQASLRRWLDQFPNAKDRKLVLALLDAIVYFDQRTIHRALLGLNRLLLQRLQESGIPPEKIIYVQFDDAGSSSPVVLNFLRNHAGLERIGCKLIDSQNVKGINDATNELGSGAIVYVDDFVGTGNQFATAHTFFGEYIFGTFSEFFLVASICEEGVHQLGRIGVEPISKYVHPKSARPLHQYCDLLDDTAKARLIELCAEMEPSCYYRGLGYNYSASMVVPYTNAPDMLPRIFRGSDNQNPKCGVFPRHSDLPI